MIYFSNRADRMISNNRRWTTVINSHLPVEEVGAEYSSDRKLEKWRQSSSKLYYAWFLYLGSNIPIEESIVDVHCVIPADEKAVVDTDHS